MTSLEINNICKDRLDRWRIRMLEEHSTPLLLVGAGHDHKEGQTVLCIPDKLPPWVEMALPDMLRSIAREFEEQSLGIGPSCSDAVGAAHLQREPPLGTKQGDQGGLKAAISTQQGQVVINFGKMPAWVSCTPQEARALATVLRQKADIAQHGG